MAASVLDSGESISAWKGRVGRRAGKSKSIRYAERYFKGTGPMFDATATFDGSDPIDSSGWTSSPGGSLVKTSVTLAVVPGLKASRADYGLTSPALFATFDPAYLLVENVTALLSRGMGRVVGDLAAIGYDAEWDCIPAAAVGAPHLRARIFILAYPRGDGGPARLGPVCAGRMQSELRARWQPEPALDRMVNGLPGGLDRVNALGDACVPLIAEIFGRFIAEDAA